MGEVINKKELERKNWKTIGIILFSCLCFTGVLFFFFSDSESTQTPAYTNLPQFTETHKSADTQEPSLIPASTDTPFSYPSLTSSPSTTYTAVSPPSLTPTPYATNTQTNTPIPTEVQSGLPGLNPVDVTLSLEEIDFVCTGAEPIQDGYVWTCKRETISYLLVVYIYSYSTILSVDFIDAGAIFFGEPDDDIAASFLGYVATAPYDGADPQAAREWIESTLPTITAAGDVREAEFGGVKFQLFGIPSFRSLEFGDFGEEF